MGLIIPEAYNGTEGEFLDLMIFMEEIGRNIVPGAFFYDGLPMCHCDRCIWDAGTEENHAARNIRKRCDLELCCK